jgi:PAS domain S-box-containing protein
VVHVRRPEALRGLLETDGLSLCPLVAVTESSAEELEREVLQAGAQEVVSRKGLSPRTLARAVERACDRWAMTRAIRDAALQQSHDLHRSLMDSSADCVKVLDLDGRFLCVNAPGLCQLEIDDFELLRGKTWASFWPEEGQAMVHRAIERARAGTANSFEAWAATARGTLKYWSVSVSPVQSGEKREVIRLIAISRDITERKHAEAALRESEERFRTLADNMSQFAWMADETGSMFWFNRRWFEYTGATLDQTRCRGWECAIHPDHAERVAAKLRSHFDSGEPWEDTFPLRGAGGDYQWFLSRAVPIHDEQSKRIVRWFGTNTEVTAQRNAEEALREADRRKDAFIAVLAHELRNPLAPIRAALEIQRRVGRRDARLERTQSLIERQVSHMARLIDDLLDVSRITHSRLTLKRETCDLGSIALQTAEDYRPTLEKAGLALAVGVGQGPMWTYGDPARLAQAIGNLLQNAGRFTGAGGRVEVRARTDLGVGVAVVEVVDTGIGIDPRLMPRLFDRFAQAEQGLAREKGGLGLGLALTRGLVELHGGRVEVHSDGFGKGSTFRLRLPLCSPCSEAVACAVESAPRGTSTALTILLVEDNRDTAETLGELLRLHGHRIELAFDGEAAIRAALERRPDVVISDIGLPGEPDGYGVARVLRANPALNGILMVALSGYADEEARRRTREAGFDMHLAKPPDLEMLEQVLDHAGSYGRSPCASV